MEQQQVVLQIKNLSKFFAGIVAVDDVSMDIRAGEVHILMGENGAGKSTLVKMIAGIYPIDKGELILDGEPFHPKDVLDSQEHGVNMVHQELSMMPNRTVAQNILIGHEPMTGRFIDRKEMTRKSQELLDGLGLDINAGTRTGDLSIALQQMVEIAKATSTDNKILILDEPTSSLTEPEIEALFEIVHRLKDQGIGIIYISHRMNEIFQIGDRITIMRDGKYVGTRDVKDVTVDDIIQMMIGRNLENMYSRTKTEVGDVLLELKDFTGLRFRNVNLNVRAGEIVAMAGLVGAGRTEVVKAIFGYDPIEGGSIICKGEEIPRRGHTPKKSIKKGIIYLSEDRKEEGLFLDFSVSKNIVAVVLNRLFRSGFLNNKKEHEESQKMVDRLNISTTSLDKIVGSLSGGNQQKVVLAKALLAESDIFLFDEPTRGIDVGAKADIYALMDELVKGGAGILMVSSEMQEVCGVPDRIYAMHDGEISGELVRGVDEFTEDNVLHAMLGEGGN